jgi:predicted CopG family antitoxin
MKMVRLEDDVYEDLTKLGILLNESYSKIIRRLIDAYKPKK